MMKSAVRWAGGALLSMVACVHGPEGYTAPDARGVVLTTQAEASKGGLEAWTLQVPFGAKQDGTELVLDFMKRAEQAGASYVSDVSIVLASEQDGQPVECRTRVEPRADTQLRHATVMRPGHTQSRMELVPVTRTVTEHEYRCHMVSEMRMVPETYTETQYDSFSKSSRSVTRTRMVTRSESRNQCNSVPVTRTVTRYEHQFRNEFIPPRFETELRPYTTWALQESAPECTPHEGTAAPATRPNRIEGTLYGCTLPAPVPAVSTDGPKSRALQLREQYQRKAAELAPPPRTCAELASRVSAPPVASSEEAPAEVASPAPAP
jgi:hypothetical protein